MKKTFSVRFLAGFLAFLMMFSYMPDLSVKAANDTSDVLVESADDTTDVASDVATDSDSIEVEDKDITNSVKYDSHISYNSSTSSWYYGGNVFATLDNQGVLTYKECPGLSYVPGGLSYYTASIVETVKEKEEGHETDPDVYEYEVKPTVPESSFKKIVFENGTTYSSIPLRAFGKDSVTYRYYDRNINDYSEITKEYIYTELESFDASNCPKLTVIEAEAFNECCSLKTVKFPEELQTIGAMAFFHCFIDEITLSRELVELGESAFGRNNISKVVINTSNVKCGVSIFGEDREPFDPNAEIPEGQKPDSGRNHIESISFAEGVKEIPAYLFNNAGFGTKKFTIPDTVTNIGDHAFAGSTVTAIDLDVDNSKLQVISESAFEGCEKLTVFPINKEITTIENNAFKQCKSLSGIKFPKKYINMGTYVFSETGLLKIEIPKELKVIPTGTFSGCKWLSDVTIEDDITEIGSSAFAGCSFSSIVVPDSVAKLGTGVFYGCVYLNLVKLPKDLVNLPDNTFGDCYSLKDTSCIKVLEKIKSLGANSFINCKGMKTVDLPEGLEIIGASAFQGCVEVSTVKLPDSLLHIGSSAFKNCKQLKSITIPKNVNYIGDEAFMTNADHDGNRLEGVVILTNDLNYCGTGIFADALIRSVEFGPNVNRIPDYLFYNAGFITEHVFYVPKRIESIGNYAFYHTNVSKFEFKDGPDDELLSSVKLKSIGNSAFEGCNVILDFTIPETVTSIGASAFKECIKFTKVVIPENVVSIGANAFEGNTLMTRIEYYAKNVITSNENIFKDCIVDTIILGDNVESLPGNLFKGLNIQKRNADGTYSDILITLPIPAKVKKIGISCFENVKNIEKIIYLGDNTLVTIEDNVFKDCVNMTTNELPQSVKTIGASAFDGCIKLSACYIPKHLETLGARAFAETLISEAIIPEEISIINAETFQDCSNLVTVSFNGTGISSIEAGAFENCSALVGGANNSLDLPDNLGAINEAAFKNCSSIVEILVPPTVEFIADDAFDGCNIQRFNVINDSYAYNYFNDKKVITPENLKPLNTIVYEFNDTEGAPVEGFTGVKYYRNGDVVVLKPAKRHGFEFLGWYDDEALTRPITSTYGRTGDLKVYAKWNAVQLRTITYKEVENAKNDNPVEVNYGDTVELKDPSKSGYTFIGWFDENDSQVTTLTNITTDVVITAKWTMDTYAIAYDLDESTNSPDNIDSFNVTMLPVSLYAATKPGYDFVGWKRVNKDNTLSDEFMTEISGIFESITLRAIFEEHTYKVTYDLDGGVNSEENPDGVVFGATVKFKNPTKRGYKFIGWKLNDATETIYDNTVADIISDIKLTAVWEVNVYKIQYIDDGIKATNNNPSTITIDDIVELSAPERFGYEFDKWVIINGQDETEIKVLKDIDSDIILKAYWKSCTYNITYIIDLEGVENSKDNPDKINVTDEVRLVPLEKEGYVFEGWFLVGKGLDGEETLTPVTVLKNIASDITLKAKFKLAIYNIEYILDGGVNNKDNPLTIGYNEEVVLKDATRDGYTFAGWCKRVIVDGNVIDTPITKLSKIDSDITLVAKWKETQYNITYILDGGTNSEKNPTTITVLDEVKLEDAKRHYSDFAGWVLVTVDADGNEKETPVTELKNVISDITLKALWKPFEYTIKFDLNGGRADSRHEEELADKKITSEDVVTLPCADSAKCVLSKKVSYALAGWSTEQYGKGEIYTCEQQVSKLCKTKDEVITLYAVWKDDYYFIQYNVNGKGATLSPQVDAKVVASLTVPRKLHSADDITRKGYIFKGWNTKKNGKGASYAPAEAVTGIGKFKKTIKLYAQWEAITYHITYETNDGILPTTAKDTFTAAKSYTLKKPKRDGYKFAGWYKTPDCRGVKVKKTAGIFEDITLYAKWEPK